MAAHTGGLPLSIWNRLTPQQQGRVTTNVGSPPNPIHNAPAPTAQSSGVSSLEGRLIKGQGQTRTYLVQGGQRRWLSPAALQSLLGSAGPVMTVPVATLRSIPEGSTLVGAQPGALPVAGAPPATGTSPSGLPLSIWNRLTPEMQQRVTSGQATGVPGGIPEGTGVPLPLGFGTAAPAFSQTEAGLQLRAELDRVQTHLQNAIDRGQIELAAQLRAEADRLQQELDAQEAALDRQFRTGERRGGEAFTAEENRLNREFRAGESSLDRQQTLQLAAEQFALRISENFTDLIGRDAVRAVTAGLKLLPQFEGFSPEKTGALSQAGITPTSIRERETSTEQALGSLTGGNIDITSEGVTGLGTPESVATQYQLGQAPGTRSLLTSGFGVGTPEGLAFTPDELRRRVSGVTPQGTLR